MTEERAGDTQQQAPTPRTDEALANLCDEAADGDWKECFKVMVEKHRQIERELAEKEQLRKDQVSSLLATEKNMQAEIDALNAARPSTLPRGDFVPCPIGLDATPTICSASTCTPCRAWSEYGLAPLSHVAAPRFDKCDGGETCMATTTGCAPGQCSRRRMKFNSDGSVTVFFPAPPSAIEPSKVLPLGEYVRLQEIEHLAWHMMDDSEEDAQTGVVTIEPMREDYDKLAALLPEDHPREWLHANDVANVDGSGACPYCTNDNEAVRETYFDQNCAGCVARMAHKA